MSFFAHWSQVPERLWRWPDFAPAEIASRGDGSILIAPDALDRLQALRDAPIGMTSHILFTAWDETNPATLSPAIISEIIRTKIGFTGLLLTDDIDMQALDGTVPERAERALAAGCDVVLNCWAKLDDMDAIARRTPPMSTEALQRLELALKGTGSTAQAGEQRDLLAQRDALFEAAEVRI